MQERSTTGIYLGVRQISTIFMVHLELWRKESRLRYIRYIRTDVSLFGLAARR